MNNGTLNVTGWHANDVSLLEPNHFLILFDNTLGRQVAAKQVKLNTSKDVAKVFGDTKTANQARFNYNFGKLALIANHNYSLISRYSSSNQGNGGNGAFTDAWMSLGALNQAGHNLDNWSLNNGQLNIQG